MSSFPSYLCLLKVGLDQAYEFDQLRRRRVQRQSVLFAPLGQHFEHAPRIRLIREDQHSIVRITDELGFLRFFGQVGCGISQHPMLTVVSHAV
jgi:hypothetical protein